MNVHEEYRRALKANAIADMMIAAYSHITTDLPLSDVAYGMDEAAQRKAAKAAGQRTPSPETWAEVIRRIEAHEQAEARVEAVCN